MQAEILGLTFEAVPCKTNTVCAGCAFERVPAGCVAAVEQSMRQTGRYCDDAGLVWVEVFHASSLSFLPKKL